jgi:hypothetical protein
MEIVVLDFCTYLWVSEETIMNIHGSEKDKLHKSAGQRRESHKCIGKHAITGHTKT